MLFTSRFEPMPGAVIPIFISCLSICSTVDSQLFTTVGCIWSAPVTSGDPRRGWQSGRAQAIGLRFTPKNIDIGLIEKEKPGRAAPRFLDANQFIRLTSQQCEHALRKC